MIDLPHRKLINEVDPNRFTGCKTFPERVNDFMVLIDGLKAGRIMKK
jgi:hypothetical protein